MIRRDGAPRCPKCGGKLTAYTETEVRDGVRRVRYVLRCRACSFRRVLQDVTLRKSPRGVSVSVTRT